MRILWHSNAPWAPTGYGQQTALFAPRIRDLGHEVAISAVYGLAGDMLEWEGMRVYPTDDKWGNRTLAAITDHFAEGEPVLVLPLVDVWPLTTESLNRLNIAAWTPVDHAPTPPRVVDFFDRTGARPIAMSRFGQGMLKKAGHEPLYVPHGIETGVFQPRDTRAETRERMGVPEDAFVVGMVAANKGCTPPRKAFPQVFIAFGQFLKDHPDAYLYLHTEMSGMYDGVNLGALAEACRIPPERVKFTPPIAYEFGVEPEALSHLYSAMDVLAHPSYGEGFGVPIIESQACGTPVIVTDWTAMTELCGAGWLVDGDPFYDPTQGSFYKCPSVVEVFDSLVGAYQLRGDQEIRRKAREFAVQYDADRVTETFWRPVLQELERGLVTEPVALPAPEVFERQPNRAERRALKKAA